MVNRIDPHDRVDLWNCSGTKGEGSERRHRRRRGHRGGIFYAHASLFTQQVDRGYGQKDE